MYAITNLTKSATFKIDPWDWTGKEPATKDDWNLPETSYCFYSGYEGLIPGQRISDANPVEVMSWIIADYDQNISAEMVAKAVSKAPLKPAFSHATKSGGVRLLWRLAEPVRTSNTKLHESLMVLVAKKLNLKRLLPGWDEPAWKNAGQYYAVGTNWIKYDNGTVGQTSLVAWMMEAGNKVNWRKGGGVAVPIEVLSAEIEKRWPGRWGGEWSYGARGKRFWDATADNNSAAVLRETGMQCFTGSKSFVTWAEILGPQFVKQYEEDRIGQAIGNVYFDGKAYWRQDGRNVWRQFDRTNLSAQLRVDGLSSMIDKGETASEVDRALTHIINERRVEAAGNYIYRPEGLITLKGKLVLNKSMVKPCQPTSERITVWGQGFPFLAEFLDQFFIDQSQLDHFLAWARHAYRGAINQRPTKGQNVFTVGGVNSGKTLLSDLIMDGLFGGHYDASDYITRDGDFSNGAFDYFLWTVGDAKPMADGRSKKRFTAALKALAANRDHHVNEKYEKGYMTEWHGRLLVTANDDAQSIAILPDVDMSNSDKINFYRCANRKMKWRDDLETLVAEELPFLGSWLLATEHADWIERDVRFGITSFHDANLFQLAQAGGDGGQFEDTLYSIRNDLTLDKAGIWRGTVAEMVNTISGVLEGRGVSKDWNLTTVGRAISHLAASRDYITRGKTGNVRWTTIDVKKFVEAFEQDCEAVPFD
jgi:hypothetical protein